MHAQDGSTSDPASLEGGPARKGTGPRPTERADELSPGAATALQRALSNAAFMAALQRDEHAHGPGREHAETSAQRPAVPEEGHSADPGAERSDVPDVRC